MAKKNECPCCGDFLDENGSCGNCGYTVGDELPTPSAAPSSTEPAPSTPTPVQSTPQQPDGEISTSPKNMKKCPTCGAECVPNDKFCHGCGHSFTGAPKKPAQTVDFSAATNAFSGANVPKRKCGICNKMIDKTSKACPYCGTSFLAVTSSSTARSAYTAPRPTYTPPQPTRTTTTTSRPTYTPPQPKRRNGYAVVAFIFAMLGVIYLAFIPGLILSKKGLEYARYNNGVGKGLCIAARVISTLWAVLLGLIIFVMCAEGQI